jgi:hypothetical protein
MSRASRFLVLSLLSFLMIPAVAAAAVPIAKVRDLPLGTTVTIEGRVTVPSGLFASASLEDQDFVVEDVTGGLYVSMDTDLGIHRNQQVRVTGTLGQNFNSGEEGTSTGRPAGSGRPLFRCSGVRTWPLTSGPGSVYIDREGGAGGEATEI